MVEYTFICVNPLVFLHKQKHDFDEFSQGIFYKQNRLDFTSQLALLELYLQDTLRLVS